MNPTPDIDIGELRKLEAAATAGEWLWQDVAGAGLQIYAPVHLVPSLKMPDGMPREPIFIYSLRGMSGYMGIGDERWVQFEPEGWNAMQTANAAFITALRNAAPALLARAEAKDAAYGERDMVVAALSKCFPSYLSRHSDEDKTWEDDWRWIVYIELPTGQASWHIHDSERELFNHLEVRENNWDGHNTERKYQRLAALRYMPSMAMDHIAVAVLKSRLAAADAVVSAATTLRDEIRSSGTHQTWKGVNNALATYEGKSE